MPSRMSDFGLCRPDGYRARSNAAPASERPQRRTQWRLIQRALDPMTGSLRLGGFARIDDERGEVLAFREIQGVNTQSPARTLAS